MCQRNLRLPVPYLVGAGDLLLCLLLFGFLRFSGRIKNRVERNEVTASEVFEAAQALVAKSPSVQNPIAFSNFGQSTVESWDNRRWRVSGYVDTRTQPAVKVRTLYFAVVQYNGKGWDLEDLQLQSMEFGTPKK